jgi:hypothetical protein
MGVSGTFAQRLVGEIGGISNLSRCRKYTKSVKSSQKMRLRIAANTNAVDKRWWAVEGKPDHCGK